MTTGGYIENCEEEVKMEIKLGDDDKEFSQNRKHIESAHGKVKYSCNQCEYKATTKGSLKTHIESVHEKVKYPCNQCDYKATAKGNLKQHIKSKHE